MKKNKGAKRSNLPDSRKTIRKKIRQEKKLKRQEHYVKKKEFTKPLNLTPGAFVKRPAAAEDTENEVKKKRKKLQPTAQDLLSKDRQKDIKEANKLKSQMESQRRDMLVKANDDEDKMIKKLEKQLGLNKVKKKNKLFADDGLDYLLEICDRSTTEQIVAAEKHLATMEDGSDFEEDLAVVTGKKLPEKKKEKKKKSKSEENDEIASDIEDDDDISDDEELEGMSDEDDSADEESEDMDDLDDDVSEQSDDDDEEEPPKKENKKSNKTPGKTKSKDTITETKNEQSDDEAIENPFSDDEVSHLSDDGDNEHFGEEPVDEKKEKEKPDVWEDIYGRKRDKEGNVIREEKGAYVPPHLRNKTATTDKNLEALRRQIKSVLNKLTGTNLHWACTSIERLYSSHTRHDVQEALCQQWLGATAGKEAAHDRLQAEHAALVAGLHANVAEDVGAFFLQTLANKFDELVEAPGDMEDKTLDNVVACLAYLYNFKIFHANLLYDILNRLLRDLTEKNIECILVALRTAGGTLRRDEPTALRTYIQDTQRVVGGNTGGGSRVKFLLEVLMAVKNNNLTKIPNYDPSYVEQLKKLVKTIIRKGNYITPLNIRLEDLLKANERGKWWVVGSAWEGKQVEAKQPENKLPTTDQKLLELARKQRMNTDVRRSIFCVIMAAEDYMDAFEKLQHLGLKGQQQREISPVLVACCLQEKTYNPYYSLLARQLAADDRRAQLSIQFSIWDKIKELENLQKHNISNLAQFLTHLIMEETLPLSVLKIIQFSDLNKSAVRFMRQILLAIIMNADFEASLKVFQRISSTAKLHMFRESLRLFIQHFLLKNAGKTAVLSAKETEVLKGRVQQIEKILTMHDSKLSF